MRRVVHVMAIALLFAAAPVGLPSVTADRIDGRSLSVPLQFSPISLDPANLIDTDGVWIATQLFEGLFTYAADGAIRENLAAKWWVTESGRAYHIELQPDARFSDGSSVTARDVQFTLHRLMRDSTRGRSLLRRIVAVEIAGPRIVLIRLESPSPDLLHTLASPLCYILPASFEALIRQGAFFRDPIGSGPYRIALRDPLHIKLSINPYYRKPRPWLTEITFQILNSRRGLRREELDRFDLIAGAPMETAVVLPGHRTQTYMHPVVEFLGFNLRHHIWKNRTLREAFAAAFDREAFYRVLYKGRTASWHPADSLIPYGMLARAKTGEGDRNRPHGQFSVTLQLSELFARSEDAVIDFVTAPHIAETKLQRAVDAATRSSGLRLRARKIALADFIDQARRGAAGIFVMQLAADIPDPHEILINFTDDGPVNYTGYTGLTAPLRTVLSTTSRRDRAATYAALAEQLRQEAVAIPIASVLNEKLFVRKGLALTQMNQYGPWYYPLNMVQPEI